MIRIVCKESDCSLMADGVLNSPKVSCKTFEIHWNELEDYLRGSKYIHREVLGVEVVVDATKEERAVSYCDDCRRSEAALAEERRTTDQLRAELDSSRVTAQQEREAREKYQKIADMLYEADQRTADAITERNQAVSRAEVAEKLAAEREADTRRRCIEIAEQISAKHWKDYKHGENRADPHYQGLSDGASEVAEAIRSMQESAGRQG